MVFQVVGILFGGLVYIGLFSVWGIAYTESLYIHNGTFSYILWLSGGILALLIIFLISQRWLSGNGQLAQFSFFIIVVYTFITTTNILVFFVCYELFFLPSCFLVLLGSPNSSGVVAAVYFLIWTQIGSFIVFIALLLLVIYTGGFSLGNLTGLGGVHTLLFFIGFGINVPVWPAHYWLTKTHVEAPTYFSIYLSGFLVNTALYGIWVFCFSNGLYFWFPYMLVIILVSVVDSSIKMWSQVDLNKLVAYGTVQEMNLILLGLIIGSKHTMFLVGLFIIAHTLLSTMFFLLTDLFYNSWGSSAVSGVSGVFDSAPTVGYLVFICCLLFSGLPFTLKFVVEVFIFSQLLHLNIFVLVYLVVLANWIGLVSFIKHWFKVLFGVSLSSVIIGLVPSEMYIYTSSILLLVLGGLVSSLVA